jgi:hypothetical protein
MAKFEKIIFIEMNYEYPCANKWIVVRDGLEIFA